MQIKIKDGRAVLELTQQELDNLPKGIIPRKFKFDEEDTPQLMVNFTIVAAEAKVELTQAAIHTKSEEIKEWVLGTYRPLFKGKKVKAMGDISLCVTNLAIFLIVYPNYTQEQIIAAATKYIESCNGVYTYMSQADYFVFKMKEVMGKKAVTSQLLTMLEDDEEIMPRQDLFDLA